MEITFTPINSVGQKCEGDLQGKSSACERRDSTIPSDLASGARSLHRQPLLDFAIQSTFSLSLLSALCHMTSFAPQLPSLNCLWASHFALSKKLPYGSNTVKTRLERQEGALYRQSDPRPTQKSTMLIREISKEHIFSPQTPG